MIMIDWVTAKVPFYYPGLLCDGEILNVTRDGEVQQSIRKRLAVTGSYDASFTIRTSELDDNGDTCLVELSGNPVKFLQGHNLFGSSDLLNLVYETVLRLSDILATPQPENVLEMIRGGLYTLSRIDINRMFTLGNRAEVLAYLYTLSANSRTRNQGPVTKGSTVYFNKTSKRWTIKVYCKAQEVALKRNKKQGTIDLPQDLKDWVEPMLRMELTLKSKELIEHNLHKALNWATIEEHLIFSDYAERIQMSNQKPKDDLFLKIKSRPAAASYQMWLDGHDLRQILPKNTFYRHRRALLEHDIDISIACSAASKNSSNVVPFCKTLELQPATLPHWVSGTDLYFEPRKLCSV
jgi:II/X family phage/plasmid replication protein